MKQIQNKRNVIKAEFQESLPEIPPKDPPIEHPPLKDPPVEEPPVKEPLFLSRR
jgi:hypothetical protein